MKDTVIIIVISAFGMPPKEKGEGILGNRDHPNNSIVKIGQSTEKDSGD